MSDDHKEKNPLLQTSNNPLLQQQPSSKDNPLLQTSRSDERIVLERALPRTELFERKKPSKDIQKEVKNDDQK